MIRCNCPPRPRLGGYIDAAGDYQIGNNPDPSYGGVLTAAPDAVLGPIGFDGQYMSVTGANPNSSTPIFPQGSFGQGDQASATPVKSPSWTWILAAGVIAFIAIDVFTDLQPARGRRR
jgi:hypothetical protein